MTLVRSNKRIAGCPPPGTVGEADPDTLDVLPPGSVEDMTKLSKRVPEARIKVETVSTDGTRKTHKVQVDERPDGADPGEAVSGFMGAGGTAPADPKFASKPWDVVGTAPSDES